MRHFVRAGAILGLGLLLLAADNAPETDISRLFAPATEMVEETQLTPALIEEPLAFAAPELDPVLPEAESLAEMVHGVKAMPAIAMDEALECLAIAIYHESKGEPLEGQLAVAQVILNRVENGRFGADVCGVITAPRQFSFVRGGRIPPPNHSASFETARAIAIIATASGWTDVVGDATHFHATRVNPGWRLQRVARIGNHIFYQ